VAVSGDGAAVASQGRFGVRVWDRDSGRVRRRVWAFALAFALSPDGQALAVATERATFLCDVRTARRRPALEGGPGPAMSLAFSPDGRALAAAIKDSDRESSLWLWDVRTGAVLHRLRGRLGGQAEVAFTAAGALVSASVDPAGPVSRSEVTPNHRWWDRAAGRCLRTERGYLPAAAVAAAEGSPWRASPLAADAGAETEIRTADGRPVAWLPVGSRPHVWPHRGCFVALPDGRTWAAVLERHFLLYRLEDGTALPPRPAPG
jgi:hypothetical protein